MSHLIQYRILPIVSGPPRLDRHVVLPHEFLEKLYEKKVKEGKTNII